jgi:hypothetical protein
LKRFLLALACCVLVSGAPHGAAYAQPDPAQCVAGLSQTELEALLRRVEPELRASQRPTRLWFGTWVTFNAVVAAVSAGLATLPGLEPEWRDSNLLSAGAAGLALVLIVSPPPPNLRVEHKLGSAKHVAPRERLLRALRMIEAGAAQERFLRSGTAQVGNAAIALAQGMYLGLRYDDGDGAKAAAANSLSSWLVGEAQILTSPRALTRLQDALVRERAACVRPPPEPERLAFQLLVAPQGLGARIRF